MSEAEVLKRLASDPAVLAQLEQKSEEGAKAFEEKVFKDKYPDGVPFIRDPHTVEEFRVPLLKKARDLVASATSVSKLTLHATIDGEDVSMEFRTRSNGKGLIFKRGHYVEVPSTYRDGTYPEYRSDELYDVKAKTYSGNLARFKSSVTIWRADTLAELKKAEAAIAGLFR
jgi:hypothetical protein